MNATRVCEFTECGRKAKSIGLCPSHYQQKRRGLNLAPIQKRVSRSWGQDQSFWSKVNKTDSCWLWGSPRPKSGYGYMKYGGKTLLAHRISYAMANGTIPDGMQVDHMCHNRACVRPDHLRAVTHKQNQENRAGALGGNDSGVRGVRWVASRSAWRARVGHNGESVHAGYYASKAEAEAAVIAKRNELFTHNDMDRIPA